MITVGSLVKVVKKVKDCGAGNSWASSMDKLIGMQGIVVSIKDGGYRLKIEGVTKQFIFNVGSLEESNNNFFFIKDSNIVVKEVAVGSKYFICEDFLGNSFSSKDYEFVKIEKDGEELFKKEESEYYERKNSLEKELYVEPEEDDDEEEYEEEYEENPEPLF